MASDSDSPIAPGRCRTGCAACLRTLKVGLWDRNPVAVQVLGICSALAVTNRLETSLVMGAAVVLVAIASCLIVSLLRKLIPPRVRLIAEITIIATFVIVFDQVLKAYYWRMSDRLGPYVGLIITNCVIMGRAESFALRNRPVAAVLDALAHGLGYAAVLAAIGFVRELLATGQVMGWTLLGAEWYTPALLMGSAPGAFFAMAVLIAASNALKMRGRTSPARRLEEPR